MSRDVLIRDALRVVVLLRAGRWRAADLGEEVGSSTRTILRLLLQLRAAGVTVERQPEGREAYYSVPAAPLRFLLRL